MANRVRNIMKMEGIATLPLFTMVNREIWQVSEDTIIFETDWSNPEPVMLKLSEMYPEATIEHWWADEDMGRNDGYRVYRGGKIVEGGYCDYCSSEAYEVYVKCWGGSECLEWDEDGKWRHKDCDICHGCR